MATALFPLSDGETLGSNFGRYADYMGLEATIVLRKRLFNYSCAPGTRLPSGIAYLAEQTRDYWNMEGEAIVKSHTEFNYATMMAPQSLRERILQKMMSQPTSGVSPLRMFRLKGERVVPFRYCDECLAGWRSRRMVPYWRLDHQLSGVYYCDEHSRVLKETKQKVSERILDATHRRFAHASDELVLQHTASSVEKSAIRDVAQRSVQQRSGHRAEQTRQHYRDLLREAGFTRQNEAMKHDTLITAWSAYFGSEYCHLTGMNAEKISGWASSFAKHADVRACPHPFMYLAAESFLEHCSELPGTFLPMERNNVVGCPGDWELVAPEFKPPSCNGALHGNADAISFAGFLRKSGGWRLVCSCGISYRAMVPSKTGSLRLTPFSYSTKYHQRFDMLIEHGSRIADAARKMRIPISTAVAWRRRRTCSNSKTASAKEIRTLRAQWRCLVNSASSVNRIASAQQEGPDVYGALHRDDHAWLIAFNRKHRSWRPRGSYRSNGPKLNEIRESWVALMDADPPIRATRAAILERAGVSREVYIASASCLAALAELVETRQAYLERVISWLTKLTARRSLSDCEGAIRLAGLLPRSFTREQRDQIKKLSSA
jgi:hypothetical protein